MKTAIVSALVLSLTVVLAPPTLAKSKKKASSSPISGVFCSQGPDNVHLPASEIKASIRKNLRKGQRVKVNYPGYGPIDCTVY